MTVRVEYDHGYVEEYADEEWAEIEKMRAWIHERIWGRVWAAMQQPLTPPDVPLVLAGVKHPSRRPTAVTATSTPQCTCQTKLAGSGYTSTSTDGLAVLCRAPSRQCVDCAGCCYCAGLYLVES